MTQKPETPKNLTNLLKNKAAIGAAALSLSGAAAQTAVAQTGGTEAPAPVVVTAPSPSGGVEAPPTTDQELNTEVQQAASTFAKDFSKLSATNPTSHSHVRNAQGDELSVTSITVPAKDAQGRNDGQYNFDIVSKAGPKGQPQFNNVYSLTASESEGPKPAKGSDPKPPQASITLDQNPATNTWEAGGTYKLPYPIEGATASSTDEGGYVSVSACIKSIDPAMQHLTGDEVGAVVTQLGELQKGAEHRKLTGDLEPAFNQQGATVNGPEN